MSELGDQQAFCADDFCGRARLFPLPNLVLFPHVIQPLHVFEPRYVEMLEDALAHDRLIAMALLRRGWESDYEGRPAIEPIACLGQVLTCQRQQNAHYNVLLLGVHRVRVVRELPPDRSFREAEVELVEDEYPQCTAAKRLRLQRQLVRVFEHLLPRMPDAEELFHQLSIDGISLGTLTDVISYALELDVQAKQLLLSEANVDRRTKLLLTHLSDLDAPEPEQAAGHFPPAFSSN